MGATVTCAKAACALKTSAGVALYLLFESTYEKNVYPHRPHWSAAAFGAINNVMDKIFRYGSICEGGMLQSRHGRITPEGYIAAWHQGTRLSARTAGRIRHDPPRRLSR